MVIANRVMFKAAQPLGPMLAGRVLCRSATRQPGVEGRGEYGSSARLLVVVLSLRSPCATADSQRIICSAEHCNSK